MKNSVLPVAVGVALISCLLAVFANINSSKLGKNLDEERYKRLNAEQELQQFQQKLSAVETELGRAKSKMMNIEQILTDGRVIEEELKNELEAVRQEKEELMRKLEGAQRISVEQ